MPLDPIIANPAALKLPDPLESYNNYLLAGTRQQMMADARRKRQVNETLNALYKKHTDPNGVTNFNALRGDIAANNLGEVIPGMLEDEGKRTKLSGETAEIKSRELLHNAEAHHEVKKEEKTIAETAETNEKAFQVADANYRRRLDGISLDPVEGAKQLHAYIRGKFDDPILGPRLRAGHATPESLEAALDASLKTHSIADIVSELSMGLEAASKQHYEQVKTNDRVITRAMPDHVLPGTKPTTHTLNTDAMGHDPDAAAKATRISVTNVNNISAKGDTAYTEQFNKGLADRDLSKMDAAEAAPDLIKRADRIDAVLKNGQVFTGAAAPLQLGIEKAKGAFGLGDKEKIANTETLGSDLAKMTLDHIRSSGLGGGNGFTDKDREFLEKAVSGQITWDSASLQRMAQLARQQGEATIRRYKPRHDDVQQTGIQGRAYPKGTPTAPAKPVAAHSNDAGFQKAVALLKAGKISKAAFDKHYGEGAAASVGVK